MKFIATLPDRKHYLSLDKAQSGRLRFVDKGTSALEIHMPPSGEWGQLWKIIPSKQKQKGDGSEWPYKLVLRLYEPDGEGIPATIEREHVKGVFAWSYDSPADFYAFTLGQNLWLYYSFYRS